MDNESVTAPAPPPEQHCVGPESEDAGKASGCMTCENRDICLSGAFRKPDPAIPFINDRMSTISHKILVMSGKGGVGKSTFSTQLSLFLSRDEAEVGLLDIDICGPSIPKMLGLEGETIHQSNSGWEPVYPRDNLAVMSVGFMLGDDEDQAIIWRGPKKNALIKQFLRDVYWNELDYLVIDTPPGTSDEHLSITTYLKQANPTGAILITTPQEVALLDVRKEINFCQKVGLPILGVVENMSGFICPKCKGESQIFPPTTGGAKQMCIDMNLPFLGSIPLDPIIGQACDQGRSFSEQHPNSEAVKAYERIFEKLTQQIPMNPSSEGTNE